MSERPLHFLVVDDDDASRSTVVEFLKSLGYEQISEAQNGAEAVKALDRDSSINFVISDWEMPLLNGLNLLQRMRTNPMRVNTPFLIMTSPISHEAEKVILAAESYVDAYIIKPFRTQVLREKIEKVLAQSVHGPTKQVLLVDDDDDSRAMVGEYLNQIGYRDVMAFNNGQAALAYLSENVEKIGLIISDWEMPEMSGLDLLKSCKANQVTADIPFLIITSQSSMERMKVMQAARASVDQYLLKPFKLDEIKERIEGVVHKTSTRKQVQAFMTDALQSLEHGQYNRALVAFEQVLLLDPEHDTALRGQGDCIQRLQGVENAIPIFRKAVEANPLNPKNFLRLAAAYEQVNLLDQGIALLQSAMQQISFNAELHFQLGKFYNRKGMMPEARSEFEKTLEIQLDHQEARVMLEMMGKPQE